jgi:hypothetical protein
MLKPSKDVTCSTIMKIRSALLSRGSRPEKMREMFFEAFCRGQSLMFEISSSMKRSRYCSRLVLCLYSAKCKLPKFFGSKITRR